MQQVTPGIRDALCPVEKALRKTFLTALFQGLGEGALGRGFIRLSVKQAVLAIPDPTKDDFENWTTSFVITGRLVAAPREQEEFRTAYHSACLQEG